VAVGLATILTAEIPVLASMATTVFFQQSHLSAVALALAVVISVTMVRMVVLAAVVGLIT
jgi:hypothetical protein